MTTNMEHGRVATEKRARTASMISLTSASDGGDRLTWKCVEAESTQNSAAKQTLHTEQTQMTLGMELRRAKTVKRANSAHSERRQIARRRSPRDAEREVETKTPRTSSQPGREKDAPANSTRLIDVRIYLQLECRKAADAARPNANDSVTSEQREVSESARQTELREKRRNFRGKREDATTH